MAALLEALHSAEAITAGLAVLGFPIAVVSLWLSLRSQRREEVSLKIGMISARISYFESFRSWADGAALAITELIHLCELDPKRTEGETFFLRRHRLRIEISHYIDTGRFFFPNTETEISGVHKAPAFQGFRSEMLDDLVSIYKFTDKINYLEKQSNDEIRDLIVNAKKIFVSKAQAYLDPSAQKREFDNISA